MADISAPVLNVIALQDHIVQPASPRALGELLADHEDYSALELDMGHTDLSIGPEAMSRVWPEILDWLKKRDGGVQI